MPTEQMLTGPSGGGKGGKKGKKWGKFTPSPFSSGAGTKAGAGTGETAPDPGAHLTGVHKSTYATLQTHDLIGGTTCAQGYLNLLTAVQVQYESEMRIASLQPTDEWHQHPIPDPRAQGAFLQEGLTKRQYAEQLAQLARSNGEAAAIKWAGDCMAGTVIGPSAAGASSGKGGKGGKGRTFGKGGKFGRAAGMKDVSPDALSQIAQGAGFQPVPGGQVPSEDIWEETDLILQQATPESDLTRYLPLILIAGVATVGLVMYLRRRNA